MQKIVPFLWFDDQAEQAVQFYTSIFKNTAIGEVTRLNDVPAPEGKALMITFRLAGQDFMALNGGPEFRFTPAISFFVHLETPEEINTLWQRLSDGGQVMMPLDAYPFSERFGWVADRYGVNWQLSLSRQPQKILPYLLFVGAQHGRAEEAMQFYTNRFPNSAISSATRYGKDQGEPEGSLMVGEFFLSGQGFMAADSSLEHAFTFNPAISFYVNCQDQAEVDRYWHSLAEGGEEGPCGWLTDPYGVSWQIVPTVLGELMGSPDAEKAARVTQAMLQMKKLDIAQLQAAYEQG